MPDLKKVSELDGFLLRITAKGSGLFDCVSRSFGPKLQIPEDPVCGSGHCHIFPYWANRLNKNRLVGYQASERRGDGLWNDEGRSGCARRGSSDGRGK